MYNIKTTNIFLFNNNFYLADISRKEKVGGGVMIGYKRIHLHQRLSVFKPRGVMTSVQLHL